MTEREGEIEREREREIDFMAFNRIAIEGNESKILNRNAVGRVGLSRVGFIRGEASRGKAIKCQLDYATHYH